MQIEVMSWYKLYLSWVEMSSEVWPWGLTWRAQFASHWWHFHTDLGIAQERMFLRSVGACCFYSQQTPGQLDQQKMDAAVTEVSRSASERAAPEAQKDTGLKSSPRCKRKVCVVAWDVAPGDGKEGFYFLFIWPRPACVVATFAWKTLYS